MGMIHRFPMHEIYNSVLGVGKDPMNHLENHKSHVKSGKLEQIKLRILEDEITMRFFPFEVLFHPLNNENILLVTLFCFSLCH